jgi:hypothetical protein
MSRPTDADQKDPSNPSSDGANRRRTHRRRRRLLNLGMPFGQVDDLLNQSEDAVALGYRVLEAAVNEIKAGYRQAVEFNQKQRDWDGKGPAPAIPWVELVDRAQALQDVALYAVRDGTDILIDSLRTGTNSVRTVARTWEQSRDDVDAKPGLAGPVLEDPVEISAKAGERPQAARIPIPHRGLARLRIYAEVNPPLKELRPSGRGTDAASAAVPIVEEVSFWPASERADEESCLLKVQIGMIETNHQGGVFEGLIRAKNFELIIAKLRVRVAGVEAAANRPTQTQTTPVTPPAQAASAVAAATLTARPKAKKRAPATKRASAAKKPSRARGR